MANGLRETLEARRTAAGLSRKAYAASLGLSATAYDKLLSGAAGRPAAKTVYALRLAFGPDRCAEWFPHVRRADVLAAIMAHTHSLTVFARLAGVSRGAVRALVYGGIMPTGHTHQAMAAALGWPAAPLPQGPRKAPHKSGDSYTTRDVIRLLLRLHLDIRCGRLVPPWPCKPDGAPFAQVVAEFGGCTMHAERASHGREGRSAARGKPHAR